MIKLILFMVKEKRNLHLVADDISVSVSFTAFFTAVTIFFTGLLLTKFEVYDISVKIPILFLIISTFGFLYATLVFANTSGSLAHGKLERIDKQNRVGLRLSEYIGVYFLVLAIPLVINVITTDSFLRLSTLIVALVGLVIYHASGFSIMERQFKKLHYLFLVLIVIFEIALYLAQVYNFAYFVHIAVILILFLLFLALVAKKEYFK